MSIVLNMSELKNSPDIEHGENNNQKPDLFEKCLDVVGFGRFQVFILLVALVGNTTYVMISLNTPYILPNAECDLSMNLMQKGLLNGITYAGMITSGFFVGFLTDAFGRKKLLIGCFVSTTFLVMVQGTAQNYYTLLFAKFFEGISLNGTLSANLAYMSEVVHRSIRARVTLLVSSFLTGAHIIVALMAWAILPHDWHLEFGNGFIVLHSWNIYLYACSLWGIAASCMYSLVPESPKFLFSHGRHQEALNILKRMYTINTGKSEDYFPYSTLCEEKNDSNVLAEDKPTSKISWQQTFIEGLEDAKPLFQRPLLCKILLMCCMQVMIMLGCNTMRLWYPQLSTIIESHTQSNTKSDTMCVILDNYMANHSAKVEYIDSELECIPTRSGSETYMNSLVMTVACLIPSLIGVFAVNLVGKKPLIFVTIMASCASCIALYWSSSSWEVMMLVTAVVSLTACSVSTLLTISVEVFDTNLKTFAISLLLSSGRIGTLIGNVMFPLMLERGCMVPFFTIGSLLAIVGVLTLFLPGQENKVRQNTVRQQFEKFWKII